MSAVIFIHEVVLPKLTQYAQARLGEMDPQRALADIFKATKGGGMPSAGANGAGSRSEYTALSRKVDQGRAELIALHEDLKKLSKSYTTITAVLEEAASLQEENLARDRRIKAAKENLSKEREALLAEKPEVDEEAGEADLSPELQAKKAKIEGLEQALDSMEKEHQEALSRSEAIEAFPKDEEKGEEAEALQVNIEMKNAEIKALADTLALDEIELTTQKSVATGGGEASSATPKSRGHDQDSQLLSAHCTWRALMTEDEAKFSDHLISLVETHKSGSAGRMKALVAVRAARRFEVLADLLQEKAGALALAKPEAAEACRADIKILEALMETYLSDLEKSATLIRERMDAAPGEFESMAKFIRDCFRRYVNFMEDEGASFGLRQITKASWALDKEKQSDPQKENTRQSQNVKKILQRHLVPYLMTNIMQNVSAEVTAQTPAGKVLAGGGVVYTLAYTLLCSGTGAQKPKETSPLQVGRDKRSVVAKCLSSISALEHASTYWDTVFGMLHAAFTEEAAARDGTFEGLKTAASYLGMDVSQKLQNALADAVLAISDTQVSHTGCPKGRLDLARLCPSLQVEAALARASSHAP